MSMTSLLDLYILTFFPFSRVLQPTLSAFFVIGLNIITFDILNGISLSIMPPVSSLLGFGLVCFLARLMLVTINLLSSITLRTSPFFPLSYPAITITESPFLNFLIMFLKAPQVLMIQFS